MTAFRTGDLVRVKLDGRELEAKVLLASGNGLSLMLQFDGMLGGYVGMMPLLDAHGTGDYRDLIGSRAVTVTKMGAGNEN